MRFLVFLLVACSAEPPARSNDPHVTSGVVIKQIPIAVVRAVDVLLVVDDSPAMAEHAPRIASAARALVETLHFYNGYLPDLRFAVTTACATGELRRDPQLVGNFVADFVGPDGVRLRNYRGDLAELVARLADAGSACPDPQPLLAARRALAAYENRSFARDDAHEVIVSLGVHPFGDASGLPPRASIVDIDITEPDWSRVESELGHGVKRSLAAPCMSEPLLDADPARPGVQATCTAWFDYAIGGPLIPSCDDDPTGACWRLIEEQTYCIGLGSLIEIANPPDLPPFSVFNMECLSR